MDLIKQVTAYQCSCGKAFLKKRLAVLCCQTKKCKCGANISNSQWRCDRCRLKSWAFSWECAERAPVPLHGWVYSEITGTYYSKVEDLEELFEKDERGLSLPELARVYQIYLCQPYKPKPISVLEWYSDEIAGCENLGNLGDWEDVDKVISNWIDSLPDTNWQYIKTPIAWNGEYLDEK